MIPNSFLTSVSTKICIRTICTWIIYHWNGRMERFILRKKKLIMCQRSDSNTIRQVFLKYTNIKISNGICICIHEVSIRAGERWKFIGSYMSNCMFDSDLEKFLAAVAERSLEIYECNTWHICAEQKSCRLSAWWKWARDIHTFTFVALANLSNFMLRMPPTPPPPLVSCCHHVGCCLSLTLAVVELCTRSLLATNNPDDRKGAGMRTHSDRDHCAWSLCQKGKKSSARCSVRCTMRCDWHGIRRLCRRQEKSISERHLTISVTRRLRCVLQEREALLVGGNKRNRRLDCMVDVKAEDVWSQCHDQWWSR